MLDRFIELLQGLSALDDYAHMEAAPAWIRRCRTLIRVAFVLCVLPAGVVALVWLLGWLHGLGATGWKVLGAIAVIQLLGILALLHRRRSPPP